MSQNVAYILQSNRDTPVYLCVMDRDNEEYHQFEIDLLIAAHLASQCSAVIHTALGGPDQKAAFQNIVQELSRAWGRNKSIL